MHHFQPVIVKSDNDFIAEFRDDYGWHVAGWYVPDGTAAHAARWVHDTNAGVINRIDQKNIREMATLYRMLITKIVVYRKSTGEEVCRWESPAKEVAA